MYVDIARLLEAIRLSPWRRDSRKKRSGGPSRRDVVALLRVAHELDLLLLLPEVNEVVVQDPVHRMSLTDLRPIRMKIIEFRSK